MKPQSYSDADHLLTKVFKNYPLVGDYVLSENKVEQWHKITKQYID